MSERLIIETDPIKQDDLWEAFVNGDGRHRPFAEQWAFYQENYSHRRAEDGPPLAWRPSRELIARSNIGRLMAELGVESYGDLHAWSVAERAEFWERTIARLGIAFDRRPDATIGSRDVKHPCWLAGARLNCVDSCFQAPAEKVAVISGDETNGDLRTTTYAELERLAARFANGLWQQGFRQGDGIALYMPMTLECVAAYLGLVRSGCRVISIADSFAPAEVRRRMEIGDARGIVTVDSFVRAGKTIRLYDKLRGVVSAPAIVIPADDRASLQLRDGDLSWSEALGDDDALRSVATDPYAVTNVLFSSGTTAEPKAIPWTQLTPLKCAMDGHYHHDIQPGDVVAWPTNIGWMMGPWLIYAALINRATIALYEGVPSGAAFANYVRAAGVTILGTVPSLVRSWRLTGAVPDEHWPAVRVLSSTGEPSGRGDYLWLMSRTGYRAPVIEYCGGTEIGGGYITGTVVQPASPATFTTAALGLELVLIDEAGQAVDSVGEGELFVVPPSIGLSETLLNKDHEAVYYSECPVGPHGEVLRRHGDRICRLPHGFFKAQGRSDDTMNLGGIKVSSLELERVLQRHEAVYECAAVGVQSGGEGAERLVVYVVAETEIDLAQLAKELNSVVAQEINPLFKIHELIVVDALPRTASNKLMRRSLRERYLRGPN